MCAGAGVQHTWAGWPQMYEHVCIVWNIRFTFKTSLLQLFALPLITRPIIGRWQKEENDIFAVTPAIFYRSHSNKPNARLHFWFIGTINMWHKEIQGTLARWRKKALSLLVCVQKNKQTCPNQDLRSMIKEYLNMAVSFLHPATPNLECQLSATCSSVGKEEEWFDIMRTGGRINLHFWI